MVWFKLTFQQEVFPVKPAEQRVCVGLHMERLTGHTEPLWVRLDSNLQFVLTESQLRETFLRCAGRTGLLSQDCSHREQRQIGTS